MTIIACGVTSVLGQACPCCGGSVFASLDAQGQPLPDPGPFDALDGVRYCSEECAEDAAEFAARARREAEDRRCTVCGSNNDRVCLDGGPCTRRRAAAA